MRSSIYILSFLAFYNLSFLSAKSPHSIVEDCNIEITDVNLECDNGNLFVQIHASYADVGDLGFSILGNGTDYGDFDYGDLPVTLGPLPGDGSINYEFVLIDNQFSDCQDFVEIGNVDCNGDCHIWDITTNILDCTSDSTYKLIIDFLYVNTGNLGFDLSANGSFFGFYLYDDLPIVINDFPVSGNDTDHILICDNDSNCCEDQGWLSPDCANSNTCEIWDLLVEAHDCDDNGQFLVDLDFNYANVGDEGFTVKVNGDELGSFSYDSLFLTLGPFNDNTTYHFVVFDNQFGDCAAEFDLNAFNCDGDCEIGEILADFTNCDNDGNFYVWINFTFSNIGNDGFSVLGNGNNYGSFDYGDLPVQIGPFAGNPNSVYELVVKDNEFPDCSNFIVFDALDCGIGGDCEIWDLEVTVFECTSDSTYKIKVNFQHINTIGDHFDLWANGDFFGFYAYADLPLTIENFPISGNNFDFINVCDNDNPDCCEGNEFEVPDCALTGDCHIWDMVVEAHDCNDFGQFMVDLDFNFANVGNDGFTVKVNGDVIGSFSYDSLYLTLGPFEDNTTYHFVVFDNQFGDCGAEFDLEAFNCDGDCEIGEILLDFTECNDDGEFFVWIDFDYVNVGNDGFSVHGNGHNYGSFAYGDLPVQIGPFIGNVNNVYELVVKDNDFPDCSSFVVFDAIDCGISGNCEIWDLIVEAHDCTDNGQFLVDLDFNFANVGNDGFTVKVNGDVIGSFSYDSLYLTLGPFEDNTTYHFVVLDNQFNDCGAEFDLEAFNCDGDCEIGEILLDFTECNDAGEFFVWIDFDYVNVGNDGFSVHGNGHNYGSFAYGDLPVQIGPFIGNVNNVYELVVKDNDFPDCSSFVVFDAIDCGISGNCEIWDLIVEAHDCNDNGQFMVDLDFNFANVGNDGFIVKVNGDVIGSFSYDSLYLTLGPFEDNTTYHFVVLDNQFNDCGAEFDLEAFNCDGDCEIGEILLDFTECNDAGEFFVWIDFDYANVGNDGFSVHGNGHNYGSFAYGDLPVQIGPFIGNVNNVYELVVKDNDFPDCSSFVVFDAIDCNGDQCTLWDLEVTTLECTSDSTYNIKINFAYNNVNNDFFEVWAGATYLGFYPFSSLPLTINDFPASGNNFDYINICVNDMPDCCISSEFEAPDCINTGQCSIFDISIDALECNDNGFFDILVNFQFNNVGNDGFSIVGNGINYGSFSYDSLPVQIGSFQGDGISSYEIIIKDNQFPECNEEYLLEPMLCDDGGTSPILTPFINIVDEEFIHVEVDPHFGGLSEIKILGIDGRINFQANYPPKTKKTMIRHDQISDGLLILFVKVDGQWDFQKIVIFK